MAVSAIGHRRFVRLAVRALVLLLALLMVREVGRGAWDASASGMRLPDAARRAADPQANAAGVTLAQYEAIRRAYADQVPAGTRMYTAQDARDAWRQRLLEFAALGGVVAVGDRSAADVEVSVVADPDAAGEIGVRLVVEAIR